MPSNQKQRKNPSCCRWLLFYLSLALYLITTITITSSFRYDWTSSPTTLFSSNTSNQDIKKKTFTNTMQPILVSSEKRFDHSITDTIFINPNINVTNTNQESKQTHNQRPSIMTKQQEQEQEKQLPYIVKNAKKTPLTTPKQTKNPSSSSTTTITLSPSPIHYDLSINKKPVLITTSIAPSVSNVALNNPSNNDTTEPSYFHPVPESSKSNDNNQLGAQFNSNEPSISEAMIVSSTFPSLLLPSEERTNLTYNPSINLLQHPTEVTTGLFLSANMSSYPATFSKPREDILNWTTYVPKKTPTLSNVNVGTKPTIIANNKDANEDFLINQYYYPTMKPSQSSLSSSLKNKKVIQPSNLSYQTISIPIFNIYVILSNYNHKASSSSSSPSYKNSNSLRQVTEVYLTTVLDPELDPDLCFQGVTLVLLPLSLSSSSLSFHNTMFEFTGAAIFRSSSTTNNSSSLKKNYNSNKYILYTLIEKYFTTETKKELYILYLNQSGIFVKDVIFQWESFFTLSLPAFEVHVSLSSSSDDISISSSMIKTNGTTLNKINIMPSINPTAFLQATEVYLTTELDQELDPELNFQSVALVLLPTISSTTTHHDDTFFELSGVAFFRRTRINTPFRSSNNAAGYNLLIDLIEQHFTEQKDKYILYLNHSGIPAKDISFQWREPSFITSSVSLYVWVKPCVVVIICTMNIALLLL